MSFKKGDKVTWTSSAARSTLTKTGTVECVIAAGVRPRAEMGGDCGKARDHESYLVRAAVKGRSEELYWPRVAALKPSP